MLIHDLLMQLVWHYQQITAGLPLKEIIHKICTIGFSVIVEMGVFMGIFLTVAPLLGALIIGPSEKFTMFLFKFLLSGMVILALCILFGVIREYTY